MDRLAQDVYDIYVRINPLSKTDYWTNVTKFMTNLHETIYNHGHEMHFNKIAVDQYYFLVKMCVDFSFTVPDIITIRNKTDMKACKLIANDIAHNLLPYYILSLKLTTTTYQDTDNSDYNIAVNYTDDDKEDLSSLSACSFFSTE